MTRILVVDDEPDLELLIRQKFRKKIRAKEYSFIFATDGKDALEKMAAHPDINVVLSDINMPRMDGLTLLSKLNEVSTLTKTVIVSAYGDMDNIRTAMNRGAFDFIVKPVNFKDLEVTMEKTLQHVLELKKTLQAIKENNILKMYVDKNVLNFMNNKELGIAMTANENIEGTVMFIDICKFTSISEKESADTVVTALNRYFDLMVKEIIEQGGQIDKFIGDAIMALYVGENHLERAIESAIDIQEKVKAIEEPIEGKPEYSLEVSIGINDGEMVSGNIGSVSLKRLDYTVIGDTVNLAARLETAANPGQILITKSAMEKVGVQFKVNRVGEITVKNKALPIEVYEVLE